MPMLAAGGEAELQECSPTLPLPDGTSLKDSETIEIGKYVAKPLNQNDFDCFESLMSDPESAARFSLADQVGGKDRSTDIRLLFEALLRDNRPPCRSCSAFSIVERSSNRFCGIWGICRSSNQGIAECFYAVLPEFRGKRIASQVNERLCNYFLGQPPVKGIIAVVSSTNSASQRVAQESKMRHIGNTLRRNADHLIYFKNSDGPASH